MWYRRAWKGEPHMCTKELTITEVLRVERSGKHSCQLIMCIFQGGVWVKVFVQVHVANIACSSNGIYSLRCQKFLIFGIRKPYWYIPEMNDNVKFSNEILDRLRTFARQISE